MKGNEIFGWKNVLKFYSIGDLFKDSIIPMVVSLILLAISICTNKDILSLLQKIMGLGINVVPVILSLLLAAYTILMTMYWSPICDTMKKTGNNGIKLLNELNSSFAASILFTTISVLFLFIFNAIGDIDIPVSLNVANTINSVFYVFVMYIILFPVWLMKDIAIDIYNIAAFSINLKSDIRN